MPDEHKTPEERIFDKIEALQKDVNKNHLNISTRLTAVETKLSGANSVVGHVITVVIALGGMLGITLGIKR